MFLFFFFAFLYFLFCLSQCIFQTKTIHGCLLFVLFVILFVFKHIRFSSLFNALAHIVEYLIGQYEPQLSRWYIRIVQSVSISLTIFVQVILIFILMQISAGFHFKYNPWFFSVLFCCLFPLSFCV